MLRLFVLFLGLIPTYTLIIPNLNDIPLVHTKINTPLEITIKTASVINNENICPDNLYKITKFINHDTGEKIITTISSSLPKIDSIAGHILHAHDLAINYILSLDTLPHDLKKIIVLKLIEMVQNGDNGGSQLLQLYHDLVNCLL